MNNKNIKQKNMANYQEVNETTQEMFTNAISESDLSRYLKITVLANNKLKELFKIMKANDILKYMTDDDVIIVLNEIIFEIKEFVRPLTSINASIIRRCHPSMVKIQFYVKIKKQ